MSGEITRRSAVTGAAVTVAGVAVGFAYAHNSDAVKQGASQPAYGSGSGSGTGTGSGKSAGAGGGKEVAKLDDVAVGGGKILTDPAVVLFRPDQTSARAYSAVCTHQGCTVNEIKDGKVFCPCHGSVFNLSTGAVVNGPANAPLPPVPVTVKDGGIFTA